MVRRLQNLEPDCSAEHGETCWQIWCADVHLRQPVCVGQPLMSTVHRFLKTHVI